MSLIQKRTEYEKTLTWSRGSAGAELVRLGERAATVSRTEIDNRYGSLRHISGFDACHFAQDNVMAFPSIAGQVNELWDLDVYEDAEESMAAGLSLLEDLRDCYDSGSEDDQLEVQPTAEQEEVLSDIIAFELWLTGLHRDEILKGGN